MDNNHQGLTNSGSLVKLINGNNQQQQQENNNENDKINNNHNEIDSKHHNSTSRHSNNIALEIGSSVFDPVAEAERRGKTERARQKELFALLSKQLADAENKMSGKENEVDALRAELKKYEVAKKTGWLRKQSFWSRMWRKRFFLLQTEYLHYGESPSRAFSGVIILRGAKVEHSPDTVGRKKHGFSVSTQNRTYYMCAESEVEMIEVKNKKWRERKKTM